ncbi:MAG: hypothetical protein FJ206_02715 [Gemmatimonadetes bacterium]|nr:hypothetical protein [Gemmatimonadota bacterium]
MAAHTGQVRIHHLDRHRPTVPEVPSQEDGSHAASAQLPLDAVAVTNGLLQAIDQGRFYLGGDAEM